MLFLVLAAAFIDTFFLTGYLFYGATVAISATTALNNGVPFSLIFLAALVGASVGDIVNGVVGQSGRRHFSLGKKIDQLTNRKPYIWMVYQKKEPFYRRFLKMLIFRFLAASRPINLIMLGIKTRIKLSDYISVVTVNGIWVIFWLSLFEKIATNL